MLSNKNKNLQEFCLFQDMNHQLENDISQLSMNSEVVNGGMKKSLSGTFPIDNQPEKKVLVLYTGGTIGMVRNESGGK